MHHAEYDICTDVLRKRGQGEKPGTSPSPCPDLASPVERL